MALTAERDTHRQQALQVPVKVAASTTIFAGGIVMANSSGFAVPGSTAADLTYIGRADETVVNSGSAGDKSILVRRGDAFKWKNSGSDPVDQSCLFKTCYVVDDETVAKTAAVVESNPTRSAAGIVVGIDADGIWVQ